jgi:hypothetical protein
LHLPVPKVFVVDSSEQIYLQEDFGDTDLLALLQTTATNPLTTGKRKERSEKLSTGFLSSRSKA